VFYKQTPRKTGYDI